MKYEKNSSEAVSIIVYCTFYIWT